MTTTREVEIPTPEQLLGTYLAVHRHCDPCCELLAAQLLNDGVVPELPVGFVEAE